MDLRSGLIIVLVATAAAAVSYQTGVNKYQGVLNDRIDKIGELERDLRELRSESSLLPEQTPTGIAASDNTKELDCLFCHNLPQTKSFHLPQTVMQIDAREGKRRRICVDCHGSLGPPWSADEQLTPLSDIVYNSLQGVFEVQSTVPHSIHKKKLEEGALTCQTCHGTGSELLLPKADTSRGQVLFCQNCKFHPEEGNYITIHIELAGKDCTTCHTGGLVTIHRSSTGELGHV